MTANEKVYAVWPDVIVYRNRILNRWFWYRESEPDKTSEYFETEEAAWRNAAESLPPQPAQEVHTDLCERCHKDAAHAGGQCPMRDAAPDDKPCDNCGFPVYYSWGEKMYAHEGHKPSLKHRLPIGSDWGKWTSCENADGTTMDGKFATLVTNLGAALPVEGKDKEPNFIGWEDGGLHNHALTSVAEPKPTPSTPVEPKTHDLKVWPEYYRAIVEGRKFFEIRKNDRDYKVGDLLTLREYDAAGNGSYTGYYTTVEVSYILYGGSWSLPDDMCVMSIVKPGQAGSPAKTSPEDFGYQPQPSSISTEPAQLVSNKFIENARQQAMPTSLATALLELQQWRKWAAAKESK